MNRLRLTGRVRKLGFLVVYGGWALAAAQDAELELVGDAQRIPGAVRLAPAERFRAGAAWIPEKQPVANGFEISFQFRITESGGLAGGADGLALVLHSAGPRALGSHGGAGGFALGDHNQSRRIPLSIAVFFDTHRNETDPGQNFVSISTAGKPENIRWPPSRVALTRPLRVNFKDGRTHTATVVYRPPLLTIGVDDLERALVSPVDLRPVLDEEGRAWMGFTASTGAGWGNHDLVGWKLVRPKVTSDAAMVTSGITFSMAGCLPDRILCTPPKASVEEAGPGRFHVVLPAHLEWGASVANPDGAAIEVINAQGHVCWDAKDVSGKGCGSAFDPPGTLASRSREGRVEFSVDPMLGRGRMSDRSGYLEFDVVFSKR